MDRLKEDKIIALRRALHEIPEASGEEWQTRALLMRFLWENTTLELHDEGLWFWALHEEKAANAGNATGKGGAVLPGIAFRADFDAVLAPDGRPGHFCGHDGHAAALCGLALLLEGRTVGKNVYLIFQHAEETGAGGRVCASLLKRAAISEVYGCHNLPGQALGSVCLRRGTFACASRGLALHMTGSSAHAAYPENGINPVFALSELALRLRELTRPELYDEMVMATVVGLNAGQRAFGMAAADGELCVTLRAHRNRDLEALEERLLTAARTLAERDGLKFAFERADVFPATENTDRCVEKLTAVLPEAQMLAEPMRWSEDFGWYLMDCPGAFFGMGAGENCPALHTPGYVYPEALLGRTADCFLKIAEA